jgi:hypothetical protein
MNAKLVSTLVVAPLFALSASAFAAEPMQLTSAQMDSVSGGFDATAVALADALTGLSGGVAATATLASAGTVVLGKMALTPETSLNYVLSGSSSASESSVVTAMGFAPPPLP